MQFQRSHKQYTHTPCVGFTIIELMVVIVIAAILMMMAVPSYQGFIKRNNIESLQNRFAAAIVTARSEAASRNGATTLCASSDNTQCSNNWSDGWIVFLDNGSGGGAALDGQRHSDEQLILAFSNTGNYTIEVANDAGTQALEALSFNTQGFSVDELRALVTICEPEKDPVYARGLILERSGRSTATQDLTDDDGIHESRFDDGFGNVTVNKLAC